MAEVTQVTTWTTVHPIPWRETSFTWLPYWVFDILVKEFTEGRDWRDLTENQYQVQLDTIKAAYEAYGDVDFIESRNGYVHALSSFTPADPAPEPEQEENPEPDSGE